MPDYVTRVAQPLSTELALQSAKGGAELLRRCRIQEGQQRIEKGTNVLFNSFVSKFVVVFYLSYSSIEIGEVNLSIIKV